MKFHSTALPGVLLVELDSFPDGRGVFLETYHQDKYRKAGILDTFVQDNFSRSTRFTLRGLHAQFEHAQAKLVQVLSGKIWDVAVDVRPDSPTYKKWYGIYLSSEKPTQIYVPAGFAHGFCVLSDTAEMLYKCTDIYAPDQELHLLWNDPDLAVQWPIREKMKLDRKSTRLNSSHVAISYAVFCLKKKKPFSRV